MLKYAYNVIMQTPIGQKPGTMLFIVCKNKVHGSLTILGNNHPIRGVLENDGSCRLYGRLVTLVRTIEYTASGYADQAKVDLMLQGARDLFHLSGTACPLPEGE